MHQEGRVGVLIFSLVLVFGFGSPTAAQPRKISIAYTATSPYQAALVITRDAGLFRKYGRDVVLIFTAGGSLGVQAMLSGDAAMNLSDGAASVGSKISGVDNLMVASFINTFPYSLIAIPEIKQVGQLKGTSVAVSRFGSATDSATTSIGVGSAAPLWAPGVGFQIANADLERGIYILNPKSPQMKA